MAGLDGISDAQIAEHLRLYEGYVTQVNALNEELAAVRNAASPPSEPSGVPAVLVRAGGLARLGLDGVGPAARPL